MFNTMTTLSANMFNIHKFDILIMSSSVIIRVFCYLKYVRSDVRL